MRAGDRHKWVRRIRTGDKRTLSDHKTKEVSNS